jgi:raffinose/stachyose/melibiose transport system substrate-binding protein
MKAMEKRSVIRLFFVGFVVLIIWGLSLVSAQEVVEITLWDNIFTQGEDLPLEQQFIHQAIERFEAEYPGIRINRIRQATDIPTYYNALRAAGIAGTGPDLATQFAGGPLLSFADFLEPLDSYFTETEFAQIVGWESVRKDFQPDGPLLGIPYGAGSYFGIYYNKALLTQAGIDVENFDYPKTWEDLLALAQELKDAGINPFAIGNQEGYTGAWVMAALVGGLLGPDGFFQMRSGDIPINTEEWIIAYEAYRAPYELGLTNPDAGSRTNQEGQLLFFQNGGAMWIQGGWANRDIFEVMNDNVGVFPIPTLADSVYPGGIAGGPNVAIGLLNYSDHKEEAITFLKFLLRPEIIDLYVQLGQTEPSNHLEADTSVIQNPLLQSQAEFLKSGLTIYPFDNIMPQEINDLFYRLNAAVYTGRMSPQEAADELQATYQNMMN